MFQRLDVRRWLGHRDRPRLLPQSPLLTGPEVISASNVDQALAGAKAGVH